MYLASLKISSLLPSRKVGLRALLSVLISSVFAVAGHGQVEHSAQTGGLAFSAGGTVGGYYVGYGERKMIGPSVFVDFGSRAPLSVEGEARWLNLNETADVHNATYLAGPRYSFKEFGRFRPYAKFMMGDGEFSFPYHLAHGSYFVFAPGGGVEYRFSERLYWRVVDVQYQHWTDFTYGSLPSYGVSSGLRVHIF